MCSKHRLYNSCLNNEWYKLEELEDIILSKVKHYVLSLNKDLFKKKELRKDNNKLLIEIVKIDEQIDNLVDAIAKGTPISDKLELKIESLLEEKCKLELLNVTEEKYIIGSENYIEQLVKLDKIETVDVQDKREIIKFFVDKIVLKPDEIKIIYRF